MSVISSQPFHRLRFDGSGAWVVREDTPSYGTNQNQDVPAMEVGLFRNLHSDQIRANLVRLNRQTDLGQRGLAFYLNEVAKDRLFQIWGYSTIEKYAQGELHMSRRKARDLIEAGRELTTLPLVDQAFAEKKLSWSKVRLLVRVVTPNTQSAWIAVAIKLNVEELAFKVDSHEKGEDPRADHNAPKHPKFSVTFKLDVVFHELLETVRRRIEVEEKRRPNDNEVVKQLATALLEKYSAKGRLNKSDDSVFRVGVTGNVLDGFFVRTEHGPVPIDLKTAEAVLNDAKGHIILAPPPLSPQPQGDGTIDGPTSKKMREAVLIRDGLHCSACERRLPLHAHHVVFRSQGGRTHPSNLTPACGVCHGLVHDGLLFLELDEQGEFHRFDRNGRELEKGFDLDLLSDMNLTLAPPVETPASAVAEALPAETPSPDGARAPSVETVEPILPVTTFEDLPSEVDLDWLTQHLHLFSWNQGRRSIEFNDGRARSTPAAEKPSSSAKTADERAFDGLFGQERVVLSLTEAAVAAKAQGKALDHILLSGAAGLGKTSLAEAAAKAMGAELFSTTGPALADPMTLIGLLLRMKWASILFIDEIHRLPIPVAEMLYDVMEGGCLRLPVISGMATKTVRVKLPSITILGATTEAASVPKPLLSRFTIHEEVAYYRTEALAMIVMTRSATSPVKVDEEAAAMIGEASLGTARRALRLFTRVVNHGMAHVRHSLGRVDVERLFKQMGIDRRGLGPTHQQALSVLETTGRPIGASRLAARIGISPKEFRQNHEPDLLRLGLVITTPRGLALA